MQDIRLDKYLWAVRIFKTRSDAADAIRNNRVLVNDSYAKPSREVKRGDRLTVKKNNIQYSYQVTDLISNRQPAKNVATYCIDTTPQSELDKLNRPKETIFIARDPGTGRPTKRDRRELDNLMDTLLDEL
ncbi:MAG: RNA-binding S4 domain-containing protein [Rikenellaceae bacterium]